MTEYISVEALPTGDPDTMLLSTNLNLSPEGEVERYDTPDEGEVGSPLAQALFSVPGLAALTIDGSDLVVTRVPGTEWHDLIEDITDALRDFFL